MKQVYKVQSVIFKKSIFPTRRIVKQWIFNNGFKLLKYKREPIKKNPNVWRVRQREPDYFIKSSFRTKIIRKGVMIVYGKIIKK